MEKKKILIPGGKMDDLFLTKAAQKMGLYVITSGTHRDAPAHKVSDEYIYADYSDKEALLKIAEEEKIDYMCSCANDLGIISTAYVCEKLGLPGHDSYETTLTLHNKDRFKKLAEKIGLASPKAQCFTDAQKALAFLHGIDCKMIVKPSDGCDGMGISDIEPNGNYEEAINEAFKYSIAGKIVIEPYIEGQFCSASCFLVNQKVVFCFSDDAYTKPTNSHACQAELSPAQCGGAIEKQIIQEVEKVANALKLVDGKIHMNMIVDENQKVHILEMHRRCSGNTYSRFLEHSTGVKWNEWIVKAEMGLDVSDFPRDVKPKGYHMFYGLTPEKNGIFEGYHIEDDVIPAIKETFIFSQQGVELKDCRKDSVGIVHLEFSSMNEMHTFLKQAAEKIRVIVS